jgi:archaeal type IV pilus assembly protein PilA
MNFGKNIRKFRRNMRAISPVIATLLMIAIAVVASLVTYAWVMGYMNFTTEKTGKSILIQSVTYDGNDATSDNDKFTLYIQNVGDSAVQFSAVGASSGIYVENALATTTSITASSGTTLDAEATATVKLTTTSPLSPEGVQSITIKVTTEDGTQSEITKQFTIT